jgi:hypothetical protein
MPPHKLFVRNLINDFLSLFFKYHISEGTGKKEKLLVWYPGEVLAWYDPLNTG